METQVKSLGDELDNNSEDQVSHLALDIGGSLIKMVYFSSRDSVGDQTDGVTKEGIDTSSINVDYRVLSGSLHFLIFETSKISECIDFISSKHVKNYAGRLDREAPIDEKYIVKATGGGAYKFADLFKEKLGISLDKVDEMSSLVAGANFLLKAVNHEAFTYMDHKKEYVQIDHKDLYPYLLVNIGSGVSMIKVDGDKKFERVSGTSVGGGTFWGLGKLLTKCKNFDELLELSHSGNNRAIDMLVGDINGGSDYAKIGLKSTAIASTFGKAVSENKDLDEYRAEDMARSLLRMISNNVAQIAYLNAKLFGLKRIFFGGFFIRDHAYTMDTISEGVHFWSEGEAKALFLRHEGFLGALGSFLSYKKEVAGEATHHYLLEQSSSSMKSSSSHCTADGLKNSTHAGVKHSGCIECTVHVRN